MSRICEVTGKAGLVGNMVSHSNREAAAEPSEEALLHS